MGRQSKTWLITDTHWNSDATVVWAKRPADFAKKLSRNLKHFIMPDDTLIHLGDVIFSKHSQLSEYLSWAPCTRILVKGNHDNKSNNWYRKNGFNVVCDAMSLNGCWLTHKPTEIPAGNEINIHGHLHNNPPERWEAPLADIRRRSDGRHVLLSIEYAGYTPICMQSILDKWRKDGTDTVRQPNGHSN